jgi:non-heme chloroperoxidase
MTLTMVRPRGLALAAAAAGTVVLGRARGKAWQAEHDPTGGGDVLALPEGRESRLNTSDGAVLAVTDAGDGPLVVLAHCYTGSRGVWGPVARRLVARGYRVVLWDQRGHGESTVGTEGLTIARLGEDLREVLEAVDATDALLAGHSMGGMTVMALVGAHPDVVARRATALVLVSTAAARPGHVPPVSVEAALVSSPVATRLTRGPLGPFVVRFTAGRRPVWAHLEASAALYAATPPSTRAALIRDMRRMDLRPGLARCPVPAVVVVGARDRLTPTSLAADIVARVPDGELIVLPEAGHTLPFEEPELLSEIMIANARVPTAATGGLHGR